jgi:hypothetical protein
MALDLTDLMDQAVVVEVHKTDLVVVTQEVLAALDTF